MRVLVYPNAEYNPKDGIYYWGTMHEWFIPPHLKEVCLLLDAAANEHGDVVIPGVGERSNVDVRNIQYFIDKNYGKRQEGQPDSTG